MPTLFETSREAGRQPIAGGPRPTYSQGLVSWSLTFAVELADAPGQVLSVKTSLPRPDNWLGLKSRPITPRMVEQTIRAARTAGWEPQRNGGAVKFDFPDRAR